MPRWGRLALYKGAHRSFFTLAFSLLVLASEADAGSPIVGERFVTMSDGSRLLGEIGRLRLPESEKRGARDIEISFLRLASTSASPGTPIYFIEGGPGISGIEEIGTSPIVARLRALADVVVVEQRGTGQSLPRLDCAERFALPLDRYPARAEFIADARRAFRACAGFWRARGFDPAAYTATEFAGDILHVADALDHRRIRLFAHSFGTQIALEALRRTAARLESVVLNGPYPRGVPITTPLKQDRFIERHGTMSPIGRLWPSVRSVAASFASDKAIGTAPSSARVRITPDDVMAWGLYQVENRQRLAALASKLKRLTERDPTMLDEVAYWAELLRNAPLHQSAGLVHFVGVCTTGEVDAYRRARLTRSVWIAGNPIRPMLPEACDSWGVPEPTSVSPPSTKVPTLVVVGTLDWRTPLENADYIMPALANGALIVCQEGEHGDGLQPNEQLWDRMTRFFGGERLLEREQLTCHDTNPIAPRPQ
jgi:pimeloyl-ACP methyl ester carboxylesterase